jgi:hypothetical protein
VLEFGPEAQRAGLGHRGILRGGWVKSDPAA